jgi:hypothetical protein
LKAPAGLLLGLVVLAGCAAPTGPILQPTGSAARGAYDSKVMGDALAEACVDAARKLPPVGAFAVAPASEGAWTLMAASDLADALRKTGHEIRLLDRDLALTYDGPVVVVKTTYVAVDAEERRVPLSKWSILGDSDVSAPLAGAIALAAFATSVSDDLGMRREGCASVTAYVIDPRTKKTVFVVTGTDERGRKL